MKAKLVLEMPEGCVECRFKFLFPYSKKYVFGSTYLCLATDSREEVVEKGRPLWCPLVEVKEDERFSGC